jgi:glycosyltransferase involved in cell wall biosynthesis
LARIKVAINVDGIERQRAKWNALGRLWYRFGEVCSVLFANAVVSDAEVIRRYYRETYRADSTVIPYGYNEAHEEGVVKKVEEGGCPDGVRQLNLEPGEYVLYVSRLEPENHAHTVIAGYNALPQSVRSRYPLVIVGDAPYAAEYIAGIKSAACPEVRFLGYQFGATYELLQLGAALYVQATEVGGTHPALVEAMGFGNCVLANDTPENREVLGEAGCFYRRNDAADLASHLQHLLESPEERQKHRRAARYRAEACYSWHSVVVRYDALFSKLLKQPPLCTLQTPS